MKRIRPSQPGILLLAMALASGCTPLGDSPTGDSGGSVVWDSGSAPVRDGALADAGAAARDGAVECDGGETDAAAHRDAGGPADAARTPDAGSSAPNDAGSQGTEDAGSLLGFPPTAIWYQDVSNSRLDPDSDRLIEAEEAAGGWATEFLEIDFSIHVEYADPSVPPRSFTPTEDFYSPDCDPAPVPVPPGGFVENSEDYACPGGDCHLIVFQGTRLYELWRAGISTGIWNTGSFRSGCAVVWDLTRDYWQEAKSFSRGEQCTSADAAGHPIAPLLFTADELRRGEINHAIRFVLDNGQIRSDVYVHPATHSDGTAPATSGMLPYGAHLRLKASFDESKLPSEGARVVARALKKYGMFLSDAGGTPLTAEIGAQSEIGALDLRIIRISDFEVLPLGTLIPFDADCKRAAVTH